jgi:ATP-dependent DNA ligase
MLAVPFEERRLAKWQPPYIIQPKFDGERCRVISLENGIHMLLSSQENPFFSVPHILKDLSVLGINEELDGELYCHGMSFEEIHSIVSRTTNLHPNHREIKLHVFDYVSKESQAERISKLFNIVPKNLRFSITPVPYWVCNNLDEVKNTYDRIISKGYEGIIVRHLHAHYMRKRSIWMMKFKPKKTDIYDIVGWEEEVSIEGFPKGRIGSIICISDGNKFGVGAGLNNDQKDLLWKNRGIIVGCKATIHYQHLTNKKIPKGTFDIEIPELGIN